MISKLNDTRLPTLLGSVLSPAKYLLNNNYPKVTDKPSYVNTGFVDAEVLKEYFNKNSPLDAAKFEPKDEIIYR